MAERTDFFISYTQADRPWAEWIAWQLEEAGYTTTLQAWDFRPGRNFVEEMDRATATAQRTIAVLSPDYLHSGFGASEWQAAFRQDPTGNQGLLMPIRVRPCDPQGLLGSIVPVDLVGLDEAAARDALRAGVRRERAKPAAPPIFPGHSPHSVSEPLRFPGTSPSPAQPDHRSPSVTDARALSAPLKVFISYKWEDIAHNVWVEQLARDLRGAGIEALLDRWEVRLGDSFTDYMQSKIRSADAMLFIMTPAAVAAVEAPEGQGGAVRFELELAKARRLAGDAMRLIGIYRAGDETPMYLRNHRYADFRDNTAYAQNLQLLVDDLLGRVQPPPVVPSRTVQTEPEPQAIALSGEVQPGLRDELEDGSQGPAMVWLPGGVFRMGDDHSPYDDEKPTHEVTVETFSMGQYPVTFEEYDLFCETTGRALPHDYGWGRGARPVIGVSWEDATAYCEWISRQTGASYRLPTEAEWEYACRAGGGAWYCFGDDGARLDEYARYAGNAEGQTYPVGEKRANDWYLYDMHGNVGEWVQDWYAEDYYERSPRDTPSGSESGSSRVVRGGSWHSIAGDCRSASRDYADPGYRDFVLGFRLARDGAWSSHTLTLGGANQVETSVLARAREVEQRRVYEPFQSFRDRVQDGAEAPEMVVVPGGTFQMGGVPGRGWDFERPVHEVTLDAFATGRYPVTVGDYMRFVEVTQSHYPAWLEAGSASHLATGTNDAYRQVGMSLDNVKHPIVGISWEDAAAYCEWLSAQMGEAYALPTEAQWEYACRAGSDTAYYFGDDGARLGEYAWYAENAEGRTHPVGEKRANDWGLYDMHGNVWEWVRDWYGDYSEEPQRNPSGPETGSRRVKRSGCWRDGPGVCHSACRSGLRPTIRGRELGFRLARRV